MMQDNGTGGWYCPEHDRLFDNMAVFWDSHPTECPKCLVQFIRDSEVVHFNSVQFIGHDIQCSVCLTKWHPERLIPESIIVLEHEAKCIVCDRPIPAGEFVNAHRGVIWHSSCSCYYSFRQIVPMRTPKLRKCRKCGAEFFEIKSDERCPRCGESVEKQQYSENRTIEGDHPSENTENSFRSNREVKQ
jgi:hypothetical protein